MFANWITCHTAMARATLRQNENAGDEERERCAIAFSLFAVG
jgi:hypothetical protein